MDGRGTELPRAGRSGLLEATKASGTISVGNGRDPAVMQEAIPFPGRG